MQTPRGVKLEATRRCCLILAWPFRWTQWRAVSKWV